MMRRLLLCALGACLISTVSAATDETSQDGPPAKQLVGENNYRDYFQAGINPHAGWGMFAQLDDPPPGPGNRGRQGKGRQQRHLEQLRILKLLELLDLAEDQEMQFLSAFRGVRRQHRQLGQERKELLDQLAASLHRETINERKIIKLVDLINENDLKRKSVQNVFLSDAREVLSVEQLGRLVIFQERFEAELLQGVSYFRARKEYQRVKQMHDSDG